MSPSPPTPTPFPPPPPLPPRPWVFRLFGAHSQLPPEEVLSLLGKTLAYVHPKGLEPPSVGDSLEGAARYVVDLLRCGKYRFPVSPQETLAALEALSLEVMYAVFRWYLPQVEAVRKQAFVGFFLQPVAGLPPDLAADEDCAALRSETKALQARFVELHKTRERMRTELRSPQDVRRDISEMESDYEQLAEKVDKARGKVQARVQGDALDALGHACRAVRQAHDEHNTLEKNLHVLSEELHMLSARHKHAGRRAHELQTLSSDPLGIVSTLADEAAQQRDFLQNRAPKETRALHQRLHLMQRVKEEHVSSETIAALKEERNDHSNAILKLAPSNQSKNSDASNAQLRQQQKMAQMIQTKREALEGRHQKLGLKAAALRARCEEAEARQGAAGANTAETAPQRDRRARSQEYEGQAQRLDAVREEISILQYTLQQLQAYGQRVDASLQEGEKKKGISGYKEAYSKLQSLNETKGAADDAKAETLEAVSTYVTQINKAIKAKEIELAPRIAQLKKIRARFQELESEHSKKKHEYDAVKAKHTSRYSMLQADALDLHQKEAARMAKYHFLNSMTGIADSMVKRAISGQKSGAYKAAISAADSKLAGLRERQAQYRGNRPSGQMKALNDLLAILQCKIDCGA